VVVLTACHLLLHSSTPLQMHLQHLLQTLLLQPLLLLLQWQRKRWQVMLQQRQQQRH
jgi:hypothetical protein